MTNGKVTVVARIKARPGMEERVREVLQALVPPTTRERGCITYDLHQAAGDTSLFMFYENWCSREDLEEHLGTPHLQAFLGKADELLAEPVDVSLWEMVD